VKFRRKERDNVDIPLVSLIDVVFILLLFFVALVLTDPWAARLMLHSILGLVLLGVGLTLDAIGFVWMRRLATGVAPESGER